MQSKRAPPTITSFFTGRYSKMSAECLLGIDIGTSRVKTVLVDKVELRVLQETSLPLGNHEHSDVQGASERDVVEIFSILNSCLDQLNPSLLKHVSSIGVCGQMHGCVLWDSTCNCASLHSGHSIESRAFSNLFTWQDGRCSEDFLSSLPKSSQNIRISSGYGCATLAWLHKFQPERLANYDRAGTIMDLIVWDLCHDTSVGNKTQASGVLMSAQNAASWGYFNISKLCWEVEMYVLT